MFRSRQGKVTATATEIPTSTPEPSATPPPPTPTIMPTAEAPSNDLGLSEWIIAVLVSGVMAWGAYRISAVMGQVRWGVRMGFLALMGGLFAYSILAVRLPDSQTIQEWPVVWSTLLVAMAGVLLGILASIAWRLIHELLTIDGVWLATHGFTDGLQADGFAPIAETMAAFIKNGGKIWVCGACMKPRNITDDQLIAGAQMVGAATAVEAMVTGAQTLSF